MNTSIVAAARGWLGTRFHHQGRLKRTDKHKGGVDCLGLLIGVAAELQLQLNGIYIAALDETDYSHYPDTAKLKIKLGQVLSPTDKNNIQFGDVLLLNIDGNPQHLAIVTDRKEGYGIIHAYAPARAVVEHDLNSWWQERIEAVFRYS